MNSTLYISLDIGGTLSKVCLAAESLDLPSSTPIKLREKNFNLNARTFDSIEECLHFLRKIVKHYDKIEIGMTGGGTIKYEQTIRKDFPNAEFTKLNQYESNAKGLSFIKKTDIPILHGEFTKIDQNTVDLALTKTTLDKCELPLQFISIGSGVNYSKVGLGNDGFQRIKVEDPTTSVDGYLLDGTCLGGGYIFGVISMLNGQQTSTTQIIELIQTNPKYSKIYEQLLVNLMQTAITLSVTHKTPSIIANGSILKIRPPFQFFKRSMLLAIQPLPFKRSFISLDYFEGYLGNFGLLYSLLCQHQT